MSTKRTVHRAFKSTVIISATDDDTAFCTGCVLRKSKDEVLVVCPTQFIKVKGPLNLQVCFFDGMELAATVLRENDNFSLLRTEKHNGCVGVVWSEEAPDPQTVVMFVPKSAQESGEVEGYIAVESLESYSRDVGDCEELSMQHVETNSDDYFMVLCDYFEPDVAVVNYLAEDIDGVNRLTAAPVFTKSGNVLGLVLQNCHMNGAGIEMKVVMKTSAVKRLLGD